MAKDTLDKNVMFYRIAIEPADYSYIFSLPLELRKILQSTMQTLLRDQLVGYHESYDTVDEDDNS